MNIFISEHEAECLKELKRQKDEYLKRLKRSRARGQKEVKNVKKTLELWTVKSRMNLKR